MYEFHFKYASNELLFLIYQNTIHQTSFPKWIHRLKSISIPKYFVFHATKFGRLLMCAWKSVNNLFNNDITLTFSLYLAARAWSCFAWVSSFCRLKWDSFLVLRIRNNCSCSRSFSAEKFKIKNFPFCFKIEF